MRVDHKLWLGAVLYLLIAVLAQTAYTKWAVPALPARLGGPPSNPNKLIESTCSVVRIEDTGTYQYVVYRCGRGNPPSSAPPTIPYKFKLSADAIAVTTAGATTIYTHTPDIKERKCTTVGFTMIVELPTTFTATDHPGPCYH